MRFGRAIPDLGLALDLIYFKDALGDNLLSSNKAALSG
jgi:hypothetical protein